MKKENTPVPEWDYNDLGDTLIERIMFLPYDVYHWFLHTLKGMGRRNHKI